MIENGPNLDVPTLPRPQHGEKLEGPPGQYRRGRYLDMEQIARNLSTCKRLLESESNNWKQQGIPVRFKVI